MRGFGGARGFHHFCEDFHRLFVCGCWVFFCWRLLGLIPGGTPFSQLNRGVRDAMSATTKRDVKHQIFAKTCNRPQVQTKFKKNAKNAESHEGTKKRAPVKSKGRHLCQSGKMLCVVVGFVLFGFGFVLLSLPVK